jgi:hypothetical protein
MREQMRGEPVKAKREPKEGDTITQGGTSYTFDGTQFIENQ